MKIAIISTSHRKQSQSKRISENLKINLINLDVNLEIFSFNLEESSFPLWSSEKKEGKGVWSNWNKISRKLEESDGFIFVVPEYGGMAAPAAKNLFLLCGNGEFSHKPGLIVSISSGNGGAYPIAELRAFSYKNTHIMWIPENIIIRNVEEFNPGAHGDNIPEWLDGRIDYVLKLLIAYCDNMKPLRFLINRKDFGNGM